MKVDSNKNAKIYLNKHWMKDVTWISLEGNIKEYHIEMEQFVRNSKGKFIVENGEINLVDIAIEQLALVLDDHPRKEGEVFDEIIEDVGAVRNNPFAILEQLKKK